MSSVLYFYINGSILAEGYMKHDTKGFVFVLFSSV